MPPLILLQKTLSLSKRREELNSQAQLREDCSIIFHVVVSGSYCFLKRRANLDKSHFKME